MRDLLMVDVGRMGHPYVAAARGLGANVRGAVAERRVGSAIVAAPTRAALEDVLAFVRRTLRVRTEPLCS